MKFVVSFLFGDMYKDDSIGLLVQCFYLYSMYSYRFCCRTQSQHKNHKVTATLLSQENSPS